MQWFKARDLVFGRLRLGRRVEGLGPYCLRFRIKALISFFDLQCFQVLRIGVSHEELLKCCLCFAQATAVEPASQTETELQLSIARPRTLHPYNVEK